jgi:16S rRNA processing protein RimM
VPAPYQRIGKVLRVHGSDGEVTVRLDRDLPLSGLLGIDVWAVPPGSRGAVALRLAGLRDSPKGSVVRFEQVETRSEALDLVGRWLLATASALPERTTSVADLLQYDVTDTVRGALGLVTDVIETGANDVLVVEGPYGEVLVPVIDDVIVGVDEAARTIVVRLLEGLLEEDAR